MSCREALRLRPHFPEAHGDLGNALCALGRPAETEASYREALRLRPDYPDAHNNLGHLLLLAGRFEEGWKEYQWLRKVERYSSSARDFSAPLWGEAIGDRTILLHAEASLGDTLQFCRYAPLMVGGSGIILEVQPPLARLLSRLQGVMQIVARGDRLPSFELVAGDCDQLPRQAGSEERRNDLHDFLWRFESSQPRRQLISATAWVASTLP